MKFAQAGLSADEQIVASFAEAWIEIVSPSTKDKEEKVASFAEAWIEITDPKKYTWSRFGRLLRGGVD